MSKKVKSARKEKRKREKQQKRVAQKALYKSYADQGKSKKSGRFQRRIKAEKKRLRPAKTHRKPCGNVACKTCYADFHKKLTAAGLG